MRITTPTLFFVRLGELYGCCKQWTHELKGRNDKNNEQTKRQTEIALIGTLFSEGRYKEIREIKEFKEIANH